MFSWKPWSLTYKTGAQEVLSYQPTMRFWTRTGAEKHASGLNRLSVLPGEVRLVWFPIPFELIKAYTEQPVGSSDLEATSTDNDWLDQFTSP